MLVIFMWNVCVSIQKQSIYFFLSRKINPIFFTLHGQIQTALAQSIFHCHNPNIKSALWLRINIYLVLQINIESSQTTEPALVQVRSLASNTLISSTRTHANLSGFRILHLLFALNLKAYSYLVAMDIVKM